LSRITGIEGNNPDDPARLQAGLHLERIEFSMLSGSIAQGGEA